MRLIIDERETNIYEKIQQLLGTTPLKTIDIVKEVLPLGDFILETNEGRVLAIIERKSLTDLLASIKDNRYEEQSYRLSHSDECSPPQIIYVIEGALSTLRTVKEKQLVYSVITSLHFFKGFCPLRTSSTQETAEMLLGMADKMERNIQKGVSFYIDVQASPKVSTHMELSVDNGSQIVSEESENTPILLPQKGEPPENYCNVVKKVKKENVTPDNIGEIMLCQVPGISSVTAIAIMKQFPSFFHLLESCKNDPKCLENLKYTSNGKIRKISKTSIASIFKYFIDDVPSH
jgi:hypothetical protein